MTEAEVKWRLRRSTLELDILLNRFYHSHYHLLSLQEKHTFIEWLGLEDNDWKSILTTNHPLVDKIRHCQVENGKL